MTLLAECVRPLATGQDRWRERDADEGQCELNYGSLNVGLLCKVKLHVSLKCAHLETSSIDRFEIVIRIGLNRHTGPLLPPLGLSQSTPI